MVTVRGALQPCDSDSELSFNVLPACAKRRAASATATSRTLYAAFSACCAFNACKRSCVRWRAPWPAGNDQGEGAPERRDSDGPTAATASPAPAEAAGTSAQPDAAPGSRREERKKRRRIEYQPRQASNRARRSIQPSAANTCFCRLRQCILRCQESAKRQCSEHLCV